MLNIFSDYPDLDWRDLQLEPSGSNDSGPCACCGNMSRTVWGYVYKSDVPLAAYFVQWTLNNPAHGANFDFAVGKWGEGATNQDRQAVSMEYRIFEEQGSFMVIDSASRPVADNSLVSAALAREQVMSSPYLKQVFALVDSVFVNDERLQEIPDWV
jgi:hypothetical protein